MVKRLGCVNCPPHLTEGGRSRGMRARDDAEEGVQDVMALWAMEVIASPQEGDSWERGNTGPSITSPTEKVQCGNQRKSEGRLPQNTQSPEGTA